MDGRIFETFPKLLVQFQDGGWGSHVWTCNLSTFLVILFCTHKNHEEETEDNEKLEVS
jgi:hypothetical protein